MPAEGAGRTALRRLLDRIRTQRDQWGRREPAKGEGRAVRVENASNEHGSPRNLEWQQASSLEEGTVETSLAENSKKNKIIILCLWFGRSNFKSLKSPPLFSDSKVSEDSVVSGPALQPDRQIAEMDTRARVSGGVTFGCSWRLLGMSNVLHHCLSGRTRS